LVGGRRWVTVLVAGGVLFGLVGCLGLLGTQQMDGDLAMSSAGRDVSPDVDEEVLAELVSGNTDFAFDLYRVLRSRDGNLFFSPLSLSLAVGMASAGARGETLTQIEQALHFFLDQEALHPAFNALDLELARREELPEGSEGDGFALRIVHSAWGQTGHPFRRSFLDTLAENYGAGVRLVDYLNDPEGARSTINDWVSDQTEGKIEDLLPPRSVTSDLRLTLVDAIYFLAPWAAPFDPQQTQGEPFTRSDGTRISVPTMQQTGPFLYAETTDYCAVELPYNGEELSMILVVPRRGTLEDLEGELSSGWLDQLLHDLTTKNVALYVPKFSFEWGEDLTEALGELGMNDPFLPGIADFSGIDGTKSLFIGFVIHRAFVSVYEEGTEAAAATAVGMVATGIPEPPVEMRIDRPFLFLIRDNVTGTILFLGRVEDPR